MAAYDWIFYSAGSVLGLTGLAITALALFKDRARNRRRCPKCWYDMSGVPGLQCPECGETAVAENKLFKTRRRWRWVILACVLLIAGGGTAGTPKLKRDGPFALVPTSALNFAASFFDEQATQLWDNQPGMWRTSVDPVYSDWERVLLARSCRVRVDELADSRKLPMGQFDGDLTHITQVALYAGPEYRLIIPGLRRIVADPDHPWLNEAIYSVGYLASVRELIEGMLPILLDRFEERLEWSDGAFVYANLWLLGQYDPTGEASIPLLARILESDVGPRHKKTAVAILGMYVREDPQAIELLKGLLVADEAEGLPLEVRVEALVALEEAGVFARSAVPALQQFAAQRPQFKYLVDRAISAIRADMKSGN